MEYITKPNHLRGGGARSSDNISVACSQPQPAEYETVLGTVSYGQSALVQNLSNSPPPLSWLVVGPR